MGKTTISWTDHSINPLRAQLGTSVGHYCEKISQGCLNCYSSRLQARFRMPSFQEQRHQHITVFLDASRLRQVERRRTPTRYFWCDMSDMFGEWVPDAYIDQCFATMARTPWHTHQVLTKRALRMYAYLSNVRLPALLNAPTWPLPNVWAGVSVEHTIAAIERMPWLIRTPAAVRFVSYEPALECVNFLDYGLAAVQWLIAGGESGPKARPACIDWFCHMKTQCARVGVAYWLKQLGSNIIGWGGTPHDPKWANPAEWPSWLQDCQAFPA